MRIVFVASMIRNKLCIVYACFDYFFKNYFFTENYFLIAAINLTTGSIVYLSFWCCKERKENSMLRPAPLGLIFVLARCFISLVLPLPLPFYHTQFSSDPGLLREGWGQNNWNGLLPLVQTNSVWEFKEAILCNWVLSVFAVRLCMISITGIQKRSIYDSQYEVI